jgi:hypothetical protein
MKPRATDTDLFCGYGKCVNNAIQSAVGGKPRLTLNKVYGFLDVNERRQLVTVMDNAGRRTLFRLDRFKVVK